MTLNHVRSQQQSRASGCVTVSEQFLVLAVSSLTSSRVLLVPSSTSGVKLRVFWFCTSLTTAAKAPGYPAL